ncbi:MAG TPA: serine/threonine-protein kinase [Gemmatimonadaceae bacterium]|nr:serine/threonine-protein kinase [Gemmatimonadaceae bacterium]
MARENLIGTTVAGYTIDREVGEGGTSSVYEAHHPIHGRVALKLLRERLRHDPTAVARFVREAEYGARVNHPNAVRTIETGVASDVPEVDTDLHFLATEWAPGEILEKYVKRNGPLAPDEAATVVMQIAGAVEAVHCQNIVHRDLKPDNIVYDPSTRRAKLLDFGIAADTTAPVEDRLTRVGFFVGTLMYVAPEALSGAIVTSAADQYSLATIAYFLLTGGLPYSAKQPREMFTQLLTMPPVPLNQAKEGLVFHPDVEAVVTRGLSRSPADRYPTVQEFAAELQRAIKLPTEEPRFLKKLLSRFGGQPDRKRRPFS